MKRLHVIRSIDPAGGGPIETLKQLASVSISAGHQVEVVSLDCYDAPFVHDFPLPLHTLGPTKLKYGYSRRLIPWLRQNAYNYDVVVVNGIWQYHSYATWCCLRRSSIPYVVYTHGMLDPWFKRTYPAKQLKKWLYWPWAEYRVLRDAAAVLFTSEQERLLARESFWLYKAKEVVVQYGTTAPPLRHDEQHNDCFSFFPELRGKRILLFMGRLHPKKSCDLVIKAFASALARDSQWHLVIAGPDQVGWRPALDSLAVDLRVDKRITWTGMTEGAVKWSLLNSAEAFLLPSHQENFGVVIAEALACGVPVLISDKVNIWREIQADGAGIIEPDTLEGTVSLLRKWVSLPSTRRAEMRDCARHCFETRFEIHRANSSLLAALAGVSGKAHNACS